MSVKVRPCVKILNTVYAAVTFTKHRNDKWSSEVWTYYEHMITGKSFCFLFCLREIKCKDNINTHIIRSASVSILVMDVKSRRTKWVGHVAHMDILFSMVLRELI